MNNQTKILNMEKSMVNELNRLNNSQFMGTRSTFITTTLNDGDNELKKSRIQNLPSYRKEDLSSRLPFVVVFQTIEIQRLSTQIEALRVTLKDAQRQAFNASNYEIQIRELSEKCYNYDQQIYEYRNEVDKLNMICEKLYSELQNFRTRYANIDPTIQEKYKLEKDRTRTLEDQIEKWKARVHALEISKNRQLDDIRMMMESQRKSMVDREIKELTLKHSSERQLLENQIRKLRQNMNSQESEVNNLHLHISRLEIMNQEMRKYEETIEEYENKFAMISQQTIRLNDLLKHKAEEIERLLANQQKYIKRIKELQNLLHEAESQTKVVNRYEQQLEQWKVKYSKLENQNNYIEKQLSEIPKFQSMISEMNRESQELKEAQRNKIMEVQSLKSKCYQLENVERQKQNYEKQRLPALEEKVSQLRSQNDRINGVLKTRVNQLEKWKNKNSEMERTINNYIIMENEKNSLQNQMNNQVRVMDELKYTIKHLEDKNRRMNDLEQQIHMHEQEKHKYIQEVDRLNSAVKGLNNERQNLIKKNQNMEQSLKAYHNIEEEIKIHIQKQINFTKQIDRINGILNQKIRQIQHLKEHLLKIENNMENYQKLEKKLLANVNQTQQLVQDLDKSRKEATYYQEKALTAQSVIGNLRNQILTINQEKDNTIRLINRKTQELENAQAQIQQIKMDNQRMKKFQLMFKEINEKYRIIEQNYTEQEKKLSSEHGKNLQLNNALERTMSELNQIKRQGMMSNQFKDQFYALRMQCQKKERDFKNLQERFYAIENILRKTKSIVSQNEQMNKRNHQKWYNVNGKLDSATQFMRKLFDMQSEMWKVKEDNINLESKTRIMNYELENENMKKSFMVNNSINVNQQNILNDLDYRKVQSTFYLENSQSKDQNKTERTGLEPLSFRQQNRVYKFNLA